MNMAITAWIKECQRSVASTFDIHVDELSSDLKAPGKWVRGAMELLREADAWLGDTGTAGTVSAAFALESDEDYRGPNFADATGLQRQFGLTPPSLYYFKCETPWQLQRIDFETIDVRGLVPPPLPWQILYCEYKEAQESEFRRSLWVVPALGERQTISGREILR